MTSQRSAKANYVAAFLLGALIALLLNWPARAADPFRLDRIGVVRLTAVGAEKLRTQQGVLLLSGEVNWRPGTEIARPANTPDWALDRPLITIEAFQAYHILGLYALQGFMLEEGAQTILIGDKAYKAIGRNPEPYMFDGALINLSTRATLAGAGDEVVAGFVIEQRARPVLIRAVGPGLAKFGVGNAVSDPFLSVKQNGQTVHFNDDWSTRPDAGLIAAATAHAGAFPLESGSHDAARVLVLEPGAYTVHATTAGPAIAGGSVLVEIYRLPDDAIYDEAGTASAAPATR
jgi:hypothetical protein